MGQVVLQDGLCGLQVGIIHATAVAVAMAKLKSRTMSTRNGICDSPSNRTRSPCDRLHEARAWQDSTQGRYKQTIPPLPKGRNGLLQAGVRKSKNLY